jgi:hypothetical protein
MAKLGAVLSDKDVGGSAVRAGSVSFVLTDVSKTIAFSSAMPSANYQVVLNLNGLLGSFLVSNKTANGFDLSIPAVSGTAGWIAVENT